MVASGLGELDKSGIAELTFKGRLTEQTGRLRLEQSRLGQNRSCASPTAMIAVGQNLRAQAAVPFEKMLRPGRKGLVQPVARLAMGRSAKPNSLNREFLADEIVQIDAGNDDIPAQHAGRFIR